MSLIMSRKVAILIRYFFLSVFFTLIFLAISNRRAILNMTQPQSTIPVPPEPPNPDFEQQKRFFLSQRMQRHSANALPKNFVEMHLSTIIEMSCPTMVRIGIIFDSGKWICNPWRLPEKCVVYSLGLGRMISFEQDIAKITNGSCAQYSFDPDMSNSRLLSTVPNTHYYPWRIASITNESKNDFSLPDIMTKLGHTFVDIMKIDIEGSEYDVLSSVLNSSQKPKFCHLLIEIHSITKAQTPKKWVDLLKNINQGGFLMYSKEANPDCKNCAYEYSFLNRNCFVQYGIDITEPFQTNF